MKTIAVINNKGGVGKTSSITAIAHILTVVYGKKVLMVDMDPQFNMSKLFGFTGSNKIYTLKEAIDGVIYPVENTIEDLLQNSQKNIYDCIYRTKFDNLDMIPAYLTLANVENQLVADIATPQQFRLYTQLEKVKEEYDICLIDCGPSVSLLNINALVAADEVYIPSKSDKDSRDGIANVMRLMKTVRTYNFRLKLGGCFLTQFDQRKRICQEAWQDCREALGDKFLPITIPTNTKVEQTGGKQKPLHELDPNGKATQSYVKIAEYMIAPNKKIFLKQWEAQEKNTCV